VLSRAQRRCRRLQHAAAGKQLISDNLDRAVVVAVVAVRVMQVARDQVIGMVAVWHRLVAAARAMPMVRVMPAAAVVRRATVGIPRAHGDDMLVVMAIVRVMKMAVMEIIDVAIVAHGDVAAARTVCMRVVSMNGMIV
jgi:hypothetical protein